MFGSLIQSERPVPAAIRFMRRLYLSGWIPTVLYKKIVTRLCGGSAGIAGDIRIQTHRGHLVVDSDDEIGRDIYLYFCYDRTVVGYLRHLFGKTPQTTMLDVGSNIGNHSLWLASCFQRVLSFEPNPAALHYLENNVRIHDNISLYPVSLSREPGTALLRSGGESNLGQAGIADSPSEDAVEISLESGDGFLRRHGLDEVDFIKIDVEGHEWEVLGGLRETIRTRMPIILFEYHTDTAEKSGYAIQDFLSGYDLFGLVGLPKSAQLRAMQEGLVLTPFDAHHQYNNVLGVPCGRRVEIEVDFPGGVWRQERFFRTPAPGVL